jgi:alpha-D-ribose 1-methylphosphonate 5-triphosphate diphosphatase
MVVVNQTDERETWIVGGTVVLPDRTVKSNIRVLNGKIAELTEQPISVTSESSVIDATGLWVLPGFIDLHCDAIEKEVEPRPNTLFPPRAAIAELEKKLAAAGITTMFHSLSLGTGLSLRGLDAVEQVVAEIERLKRAESMTRHRLHLRYEVLYREFLDKATQWIREGKVDYFSYMIHAPGIGQYKRPGSFEKYVMKNQGITIDEVREVVKNVQKMAAEVDWNDIAKLTDLARAHRITVASHDDDSTDDIDRAHRLGAKVSEFPLNLQTAAYARSQGLHVCVGAPNVVRGQSHDHNLRAIEAIRAGEANILCSDYYPPSMLLAIFKLYHEERIPLPDAVKMASLHPAIAAGISDRFGSIEPGKFADLLLVEETEGLPVVRRTLINGKTVYLANRILADSYEK